MIELEAAKIAEIVSGAYHGPAGLVINGEFKFDSREIKPGDVFIALAGEHQDGHEFIDSTFLNGAVLALTSRPVAGSHIQVDDVLTALAALAKYLREQLPEMRVVGITGSQGKTTTKDILSHLLSTFGECIAPAKSFNNELGVPITLLRCRTTTKFCILEMGARHIGDIAQLAKIARPDIGIVLRVGSAHLGEFGSREGIAQAKSELIRGLAGDSIAILGTYDEFTPKMADSLSIKKITFGENARCDVRAADIEMHGVYPAFDLVTPEGRERVELQLIGQHQISNALAASAAALALGMSTSQIASALSTYQSKSRWRMELTDLDGVTLLNDSYNANPESMAAALRSLVLLTQERGGRSWAFLGRMHELGAESANLHREVGALAHELKVDQLIAIGEAGYLSGATESTTNEHFCPDLESAAKLIEEIEDGDVVLVKASRAESLERLADLIVESRGNGSEA